MEGGGKGLWEGRGQYLRRGMKGWEVGKEAAREGKRGAWRPNYDGRGGDGDGLWFVLAPNLEEH